MTDIDAIAKELRDLIARAGNERWAVDPDDRPGMAYNNHIVVEGVADARIAFMAHDGIIRQAEFDAKADLIAAAHNHLPAVLDDRDALRARVAGLTEALRAIRAHTDAEDENSYRRDDPEGCLETVFYIANAALAPAPPAAPASTGERDAQ